MKTSVIVPSYRSAATLGRTLKSLRAIPESMLNEIIVVDSSEDEASRRFVASQADGRVQVIALERQTMPAVARNIGARHAVGDLLVFIDSDAYAAQGWLERILEAHASGCRVGGGSVGLPDFQSQKPVALAQYYLQFNEFLKPGVSGSPALERRRVRFVPSCNLFCEKKLFDSVGGFPEIRASEDVLFGLAAGRQTDVWFVPEAEIKHVFRESYSAFFSNQRLLGRYIFLYRKKEDPDRFYYKGLWPVVFLPAFLAVKLARIIWRVVRLGLLDTLRFALVFPFFLAGLAAWAWGFGAAALENEEGVPV